MDGSGHIARDGNGRFVPGTSGNPAGKKLGTRNRASVLREALEDGEATAAARVVIDKALGGDAVAARFLLDRLEPKPRGRTIQLELPEGESAAGDVVALFNSALRALASGEITPAEAVEISRFLEGRYRVLRAWQLEEKLTRWNDPLPVPGDRFVPEGVSERVVDPLRKSSPSPNIPSPPAERGALRQELRRDAQGWRGAAEPYPKLGKGGDAAGKMSDRLDTTSLAQAVPPHLPPERPPLAGGRPGVGDASLSLRNPPELWSKGPRGERENTKAGEEPAGGNAIPLDLAAIPDDLVTAIRERILSIPGVREAAFALQLPPGLDLHPACNSTAPASCATELPMAQPSTLPTIAPPITRPPLLQPPLLQPPVFPSSLPAAGRPRARHEPPPHRPQRASHPASGLAQRVRRAGAI